MNKQQFELALDATSVKPVHRENINGQEVFVADGFISPSQLKYLDKFGVSATDKEFPYGCFATIWYAEAKIGLCGIAIYQAFHDQGSVEAKAQMRIKSAVVLARNDLAKRRKMN